MFKADLHIHTSFSFDCRSSVSDIIERCVDQGINCSAICDHGTIEGALQMEKIAPFKIIISEEIATTSGEIIGMFLNEPIKSGLSLGKAIELIKKQQGLVCIPHPGAFFRSSALNYSSIISIIKEVDIIEIYNARNFLSICNVRAKDLAIKFSKLCSAGSDAHTLAEIGKTYIEMPKFTNKEEFLISLKNGRIFGNLSNPIVHLISTSNKLLRQLTY